MTQSGTLTEISPFGTGFIEVENGRVLGFHYSMLASEIPLDQWPKLEGKKVLFDLFDGSARNVKMVSSAVSPE